MPGRFQGKTFIQGYNNGVYAFGELKFSQALKNSPRLRAVIEWYKNHPTLFSKNESDHLEILKKIELVLQLRDYLPVFVFAARTDRAESQPWFLGDKRLAETLLQYIRSEGGIIVEGGYVPFSNGHEMGTSSAESLLNEIEFFATEEEFEDVFGISLEELKLKSEALTT